MAIDFDIEICRSSVRKCREINVVICSFLAIEMSIEINAEKCILVNMYLAEIMTKMQKWRYTKSHTQNENLATKSLQCQYFPKLERQSSNSIVISPVLSSDPSSDRTTYVQEASNWSSPHRLHWNGHNDNCLSHEECICVSLSLVYISSGQVLHTFKWQLMHQCHQ